MFSSHSLSIAPLHGRIDEELFSGLNMLSRRIYSIGIIANYYQVIISYQGVFNVRFRDKLECYANEQDTFSSKFLQWFDILQKCTILVSLTVWMWKYQSQHVGSITSTVIYNPISISSNQSIVSKW